MNDAEGTSEGGTGEADRHLLALIRTGDADGWSQFVDRYERRLFAFALGRVDQPATAEDLVQETFIAFLKSMDQFREQGSLESLLFRILRRRIVDHYRSTGQDRLISSCKIVDDLVPPVLEQFPSGDLTASQYVRREEQSDEDQFALCQAIARVTNNLRDAEKFRDMKIAEGLFYAGLANQKLADLMSASPNEIAVVKHRLIQKLSDLIHVGESLRDSKDNVVRLGETDLHAAWESHRPSCPKRSTLGKYTLDILSPAWKDFVDFHVKTLGCLYCNANLDELNRDTGSAIRSSKKKQLFQSTVGFLPPSA